VLVENRHALMLAVGTFAASVVGVALLFVALDVDWLFLWGALMAFAVASWAVYRTSRSDPPRATCHGANGGTHGSIREDRRRP
jgi:uncharacterized membrane protein YfcA